VPPQQTFMRKVVIDNNPFVFKEKDLPMVVHGKEGSGASLFSIVIAGLICRSGRSLCFWSAYPMAKEEFRNELNGTPHIHSVKSNSDITGEKPQVIIMENEDPGELVAALRKIDPDRVLFVKNFETLPEVARYSFLKRKAVVISGDLEGVVDTDTILKFPTRIFFSPFSGIDLPALEKYQGFMISPEKDGMVTLGDFSHTENGR
jgi:hypothetical protein